MIYFIDLAKFAAFFADGTRIVSMSEDKRVRVWDADSGACLRRFPVAVNDEVSAVAFFEGGFWSCAVGDDPRFRRVARALRAVKAGNAGCCGLPQLAVELWEHVFSFVCVPSRFAVAGKGLSVLLSVVDIDDLMSRRAETAERSILEFLAGI